MEMQIKMISSATKAVSYVKQNPLAIDEEVFQAVSDYIARERIRDEKIIRGMIASASKAIEIARKNPGLTEKEILRQVMNILPFILDKIEHKE